MPVDVHIPIFLQNLLIVVLVFLPVKIYGKAVWVSLKSKVARHNGSLLLIQKSKSPSEEKAEPELGLLRSIQGKEESTKIQLYKDLYFKLQNLEQFPDILPQSRDLLISLFSETLGDALNDSDPGILFLKEYTGESLAQFLRDENDNITGAWERYVARRRAGSPTELFQNKEEAIWWLKQIAPVKYVDGAWLGHVNKITTPFTFRHATKDAWQVLSEELGDGNPEMNHVYIYRELMEDIGADLPEADTADFIHPRHQLDQECVWKAAIAQLLISLFPHEFLPEILGYNLHFEGLTMETMKAAKEVEEVGLNAYYFILHISIDNADSGHTAIAAQAVDKYMERVLETEGKASAEVAWRRVQAGFLLSKGLSAGPQSPSRRKPASESFPRTTQEAEVIRIFNAKAPVAHKIHCNSRMKFGGRRLDDWLEPYSFAGKQWQMDFLNSLSCFKPWIRKGNSGKSKLIQELSWRGKMFGSFTQNEVEIVKRWIDSLREPDPHLYWSFVGRSETRSCEVLQNLDVRVDYPVLSPRSTIDISTWPDPSTYPPLLHHQSSLVGPTNPDLSILLPLWFANPCLLESFVCIPAKTTTVAASSIVRLLRAQCGFDVEGSGVAGMDEARRTDNTGLVELGLEMMKSLGLLKRASLKDVLETWPSEFALKMLKLSVRPMANGDLLFGLAWAFTDLHEAMTTSSLLSAASKVVLVQIVHRERESLKICFDALKYDKVRCADFKRGYDLGKAEIQRCFGQSIDSKENLPSSL